MDYSNTINNLVSIIMPAYNAEEYIGEAIESLMSQTHKNIELIIINDGSTDETINIIKRYSAKDPRIRHLTQKNGGQSIARNAGIKIAKGAFIAYHDADDTSHPERIEKELNLLLSKPEINMVYCGTETITADSRPIARRDAQPYNSKKLLIQNYIPCGSVMHTRSILDKTGMWGDDIDWGMWLRMSENCTIDRVKDPLYRYRVHGKNLSTTRGWKGNMLINLHIFEQRYNRHHEKFVKWKMRSIKCQVAIITHIPGAQNSRYVCNGLAIIFKTIESFLLLMTKSEITQKNSST